MISTTSSGLCAVGGALLVAQLYPVLRFSAEQLLYLSVLIGIYTVPMVAVAFLIQKRWLRGTLAYLELVQNGSIVQRVPHRLTRRGDRILAGHFHGVIPSENALFFVNQSACI